MKLPRKLEDDLIDKLCANLKEHPEEWDKRQAEIEHKDGLQIWTDRDFWWDAPIHRPQQLGLRWRNKFRLRRVIKAYVKNLEPTNPIDFLKANNSAEKINMLSSAYNDPLIKYRERFKNEPPTDIVELAKQQKLTVKD